MASVVVKSGAGLAQEVVARGHRLQADEPVEAGGTDTGPNPYDLLLAALGTCSSMTLRLYADRKGWPLQGVEIDLRHDRIHAEDCRDCETKEGWIDRIVKRVALRGPLDAAQRQRLMEIAARCPVQRTLTGEIHIEQELVGEAPAAG